MKRGQENRLVTQVATVTRQLSRPLLRREPGETFSRNLGRTVGRIRDEAVGLDAERLLSPFDHRLGCANLGLADRPGRFDIHDNTELNVDEVIVGVGEERGVAQCASPLRGWVGRRDKLRHDVGRATPCWIVEIGEVVLNGAPGPHRVDVVAPFIARRRAALIGVRGDQADIDGETIAADKASFDARNDDMFEDWRKTS